MSEKESERGFGLKESLVESCDLLGWKKPTKIQEEVLPEALKGVSLMETLLCTESFHRRDIIALAETGSGKTGAFALPILQKLIENPSRVFALILTPTRELAFQIAEQFEALGSPIGLSCAVVVGGVDNVTQAIALSKKPHIIIATPGRIVDHLENTKGFSIKTIKFLVMDEADRILNMDFEEEIDKIIKVAPVDRTTYLFSATMTSKVQKLQRASLKDPARIEISSKYTTVETLQQYYIFIPQKYKSKRLAALRRFKAQTSNILVATDVASRGLDIPHVDVVINMDVPTQSKDYIHRVGRTARAGRFGKAITLVSQYDIDLYQRIEKLIDKKLPEYPTNEKEVLLLANSVSEAERLAKIELKENNGLEDIQIDEMSTDERGLSIKLPESKKHRKTKNSRKRKMKMA